MTKFGLGVAVGVGVGEGVGAVGVVCPGREELDSEPPQPDADNARRRKESSRRRRNVEPIGADPIRPAATAGAASLSGSRYVGVSKRLLLGG